MLRCSAASCPLPITNYKEIVLAHGSGGKLSHQLIEKMILPQFRNELLEPLHDGAIFSLNGATRRLQHRFVCGQSDFFPGRRHRQAGRPRHRQRSRDVRRASALSLGRLSFSKKVLPMEDFWRVVQSMRQRQTAAGVKLVTGDTKVVDRGKADKIFINTSGIGVVPNGMNIHPARRRSATRSSSAGRSPCTASPSCRCAKGWNLKPKSPATRRRSTDLVEAILAAGDDVHVLRDPTRGGVTSALTEIAQTAEVGMLLNEAADSDQRGSERARAKFSGSIRFMSPTKANCSPSFAPEDADLSLTAMRAIRWAETPRSSAESWTIIPDS